MFVFVCGFDCFFDAIFMFYLLGNFLSCYDGAGIKEELDGAREGFDR